MTKSDTGGCILRRVPCVLDDEDVLPDALDDLHQAGATEEVVHGPADVRLRADVGDEQRRDAMLGMVLGPIIIAAAFVVGTALLFPGSMGLEAIVIAGLGVLVGMAAGAFFGAIAGLFLHPDDGPEIHLDPGEVLVFAHGDDLDRLEAILEGHGARCIRPDAVRRA